MLDDGGAPGPTPVSSAIRGGIKKASSNNCNVIIAILNFSALKQVYHSET